MKRQFDLVLIGAGVSTLYTLLNLLECLAELPPEKRGYRLALVEARNGWGGVPYGERSSSTTLLITSLRNFLPEPERGLFSQWLTQHRDTMLEPFRREGGPASAKWLAAHAGAMAQGQWDDLYLPRYLFGHYMTERVERAIAQAQARCTVERVAAEVTQIDRGPQGFTVDLADQAPLTAPTVLLAVGSPPNARKLGDSPSACLVEDPYEPGLPQALARVAAHLETVPAPEILLLGASASTMDLLYALDSRLGRTDIRYNVLAPSGKLPDLLEDHTVNHAYFPPALKELSERGTQVAREIYEAAVRDIERGEGEGLTTSHMLSPISSAVGALVKQLPLAAKQEFAAVWGNAIGRWQRRAGPEYLGVASRLSRQGRLHIIPGRFRRVTAVSAGLAQIEYEASGVLRHLNQPQAAVINCAGFAKLEDLPEDHLLRRLLQSGLAAPTASGNGLAVTDRMEAADGLFVLGPLLAGNVVADTPIWHLEHCGRISTFSQTLGRTLAQRISKA